MNGQRIEARPLRLMIVPVLLAVAAILFVARQQALRFMAIAKNERIAAMEHSFVHYVGFSLPFVLLWPLIALVIVPRERATVRVTLAALFPVAVTLADLWLNLAALGELSARRSEAMRFGWMGAGCGSLVLLFAAVKRSRPALDRLAGAPLVTVAILFGTAMLYPMSEGRTFAYAGAAASGVTALVLLGAMLTDARQNARQNARPAEDLPLPPL